MICRCVVPDRTCDASNLGDDCRLYAATILGFSGILGYADGLIIVNSAFGLFYHDLESGNTTHIAPAEETANGIGDGDGIFVDDSGNRLYMMHNVRNRISVFDLAYDSDQRTVRADRFGCIASELFDSPTASAQYRDRIYTVNARFESIGLFSVGEGDLTSFSEQFSVVTTNKSDVIEC